MNTNPKRYTIRKVICLDQELSDQIDQIRFGRRIRKESDVMRMLFRAGLEVLNNQPATEAGK
jgi:hypothetical protein